MSRHILQAISIHYIEKNRLVALMLKQPPFNNLTKMMMRFVDWGGNGTIVHGCTHRCIFCIYIERTRLFLLGRGCFESIQVTVNIACYTTAQNGGEAKYDRKSSLETTNLFLCFFRFNVLQLDVGSSLDIPAFTCEYLKRAEDARTNTSRRRGLVGEVDGPKSDLGHKVIVLRC
jgi:hypothetical protein